MILGIDIGGTKTLLGVFNDKGLLIEQLKFATNESYDKFLVELAQNLKTLKNREFSVCVTAVPGKLDRQNGVAEAYGNLTWPAVHIEAEIKNIVGCKVLIENDAKLAALSEAQILQSKYQSVFYLTVSTGIGGGLVTDGKIDPHFQDAEVGQIPLEHNGKMERWEDFASGKSIVARFGKKAKDITDQVTWDIIARNIAVGLIDIIATITPQVIIIGGGVGSHLEKFREKLNKHLQAYSNPLIEIPPIHKAKRAEEAVIYGCYTLAKQYESSK